MNAAWGDGAEAPKFQKLDCSPEEQQMARDLLKTRLGLEPVGKIEVAESMTGSDLSPETMRVVSEMCDPVAAAMIFLDVMFREAKIPESVKFSDVSHLVYIQGWGRLTMLATEYGGDAS